MIEYMLCVLLIFSSCFARPAMAQAVSDQLKTIPQNLLKLDGFVGEKTDLIIENRVKAQDYDYLVEPFRHKTETHMWQSEFWGKWMLGAVASWEYTHDPELMEMMDQSVINLLETQLPGGYIGNYPPGISGAGNTQCSDCCAIMIFQEIKRRLKLPGMWPIT